MSKPRSLLGFVGRRRKDEPETYQTMGNVSVASSFSIQDQPVHGEVNQNSMPCLSVHDSVDDESTSNMGYIQRKDLFQKKVKSQSSIHDAKPKLLAAPSMDVDFDEGDSPVRRARSKSPRRRLTDNTATTASPSESSEDDKQKSSPRKPEVERASRPASPQTKRGRMRSVSPRRKAGGADKVIDKILLRPPLEGPTEHQSNRSRSPTKAKAQPMEVDDDNFTVGTGLVHKRPSSPSKLRNGVRNISNYMRSKSPEKSTRKTPLAAPSGFPLPASPSRDHVDMMDISGYGSPEKQSPSKSPEKKNIAGYGSPEKQSPSKSPERKKVLRAESDLAPEQDNRELRARSKSRNRERSKSRTHARSKSRPVKRSKSRNGERSKLDDSFNESTPKTPTRRSDGSVRTLETRRTAGELSSNVSSPGVTSPAKKKRNSNKTPRSSKMALSALDQVPSSKSLSASQKCRSVVSEYDHRFKQRSQRSVTSDHSPKRSPPSPSPSVEHLMKMMESVSTAPSSPKPNKKKPEGILRKRSSRSVVAGSAGADDRSLKTPKTPVRTPKTPVKRRVAGSADDRSVRTPKTPTKEESKELRVRRRSDTKSRARSVGPSNRSVGPTKSPGRSRKDLVDLADRSVGPTKSPGRSRKDLVDIAAVKSDEAKRSATPKKKKGSPRRQVSRTATFSSLESLLQRPARTPRKGRRPRVSGDERTVATVAAQLQIPSTDAGGNRVSVRYTDVSSMQYQHSNRNLCPDSVS